MTAHTDPRGRGRYVSWSEFLSWAKTKTPLPESDWRVSDCEKMSEAEILELQRLDAEIRHSK